MSRNTEYRFGAIPRVNIKRSVFKMRKNVKGTFNLGYIIPFYVNQDVLPGDTFKIKQSIVCRMLTPIYPTMDNLVLDTYFFAEPIRRTWDHFKEFMGENTGGSWTQQTIYEIPQLRVKSTASGTSIPSKGSLWDYMGLPIGIKGADSTHPVSVSALPFRAYVDICNFFFRNENFIAPYSLLTTDNTFDYSGSTAYLGGTPIKASRLPDYLSTALPSPQKSPTGAIKIPLGTSAPVYGNGKGGIFEWKNGATMYAGQLYSDAGTLKLNSNSSDFSKTTGSTLDGTTSFTGTQVTNIISKSTANSINTDTNLYADLSQATASTINALRLAFQTQKLFEADSRNGTRYFDEILNGHFGVTSGAALFEKPRYLGGKRISLQMNQVAQTADTTNNVLGATGAFSLTADVDHIFTQSFTEHTIIIGVMLVRYLSHSYQQNIPRSWSRKQRLDFYWPQLAHLGEQPILNKEIYADGSANDDEVWGYQERWAEYKYEQNTICGELRSTFTSPLDAWHYGDKYITRPYLNQNWLEEDDTYLKRTLAVQNHDQFIFDTDLDITAIRPIPTYCTPGLIDHF